MSARLNSLKIRTQLLLLVVPLLLLLAALAGQRIWNDWRENLEFRTGQAVVTKVNALAALVHQTQLERGLSLIWLNRGESADLDAVKAQRARADQARSEAIATLQASIAKLNGASGFFAKELQVVRALDAELAPLRQQVDARSRPAAEVVAWYTARIEGFIASIYDSVEQSPTLAFGERIQAYGHLVSAREHTGRERNAVNAALQSDAALEPAALVQLATAVARQGVYLDLYRRTAAEDEVRALDKLLDVPAVREAQRIRELVVSRANQGRFGVPAADWWPAITGRMDQLKAHDSRIAESLAAEATAFAARAEQRFWFTLAVSVAVLAATLLLVVLVISGVQKRLAQLQQAMKRIATTFNFRERVQVGGADEIAGTADAFNQMMDVISGALTEVDQVMAALAEGDFSQEVRAPLAGDMDRLKSSVNATRQQLGATMQVLNGALLAMREGDFSRRVQAEAAGEYGRALDAARAAMDALQTMIGSIGRVMEGVAAGNLAERVQAQGRGQLARLRDDINSSLDALARAMVQIHGNTRLVATASNETSTAIGQISDGAQNQTHAIGQVATAVRQTSTAVSDVSRSTSSASEQSRESVAILRQGMDRMQHMVEVVTRIADNSTRISKITEVIEKIAYKTNMLSLNAAIEAARAGEHGKGFAVVADEIGKLAVSSAESSQEIARLVQQAGAETAKAVEAVQQVQTDMGRIENGARQTDGLLGQISSALEEQASAVEEINANLSSLDRIARSNAAAAEQITATVIELSRLADGTRQEVERFRLAQA